MYANERGTITASQDAIVRRALSENRNDPLAQKALQAYQNALAKGELKIKS
jgi:hypothetical protein